MNREIHIFILFVLKHYFMRHLYPLELVVVIMRSYYNDGWIKIYFEEYINFGRKTCVDISRFGLGIDKVMFKFILPELPNKLVYKKFCVYDLIQCITVEIGSYSLQLNSENLKIFDKAYRQIDIIRNQEIIWYMFDLTYFFGESMNLSDGNFRHALPMNFKGIRLVDCRSQSVRLCITLNKIYHMIDASDDVIRPNQNILAKLLLDDVIVYGHYVGLYQKNHNLINQGNMSIIQNMMRINMWKGTIHPSPDHCRFSITNRRTSKIIFCSKMLDKIEYIRLHDDGRELMNIFNLGEYKKIYESKNCVELADDIFVIDVNSLIDVICLMCDLRLYDICDYFEFSCVHDTNEIRIYKNDIFKLYFG